MRYVLRRAVLAAVAALALSSCATPTGAPNPAHTRMAGGVLTDAKGMTLYTFDRDVPGSGASACRDACARKWLPYLAQPGEAAAGAYTLVRLDDGSAQWALQGKPLYYWPEDFEPGEKLGDGYNNLWRVVGPDGPTTVRPAPNADGY